MPQTAILIGIGLFTGVYSGLMGLGGGTVMIPLMLLVLHFTPHQAVATSLAVMIPPVTLPAVIQYYREGHVKIVPAAWIALGLICGIVVGQMIASRLPEHTLRLVFGFVLTYVAAYTIFDMLGKQHLVRSMVMAGVMVGVAAALFWLIRFYDLRAA